MKESEESTGGSLLTTPDNDLETRIFRVMGIAVAAAVLLSPLFMPWRFTTGLFLGGALSLLNYHWMRTSIASLIQARAAGGNASANGSRYIFRYFVIAGTVVAAYALNIVSLPATIIGLCSFVIALFAEAFRQFFFPVHREGTN
ncbi:MAG TPA: ATP synthase subunit I [Pyrinomonadaceae bacterium]|nr:ATP synthase subunit I [Pyrinomonadaceae bacterium]